MSTSDLLRQPASHHSSGNTTPSFPANTSALPRPASALSNGKKVQLTPPSNATRASSTSATRPNSSQSWLNCLCETTETLAKTRFSPVTTNAPLAKAPSLLGLPVTVSASMPIMPKPSPCKPIIRQDTATTLTSPRSPTSLGGHAFSPPASNASSSAVLSSSDPSLHLPLSPTSQARSSRPSLLSETASSLGDISMEPLSQEELEELFFEDQQRDARNTCLKFFGEPDDVPLFSNERPMATQRLKQITFQSWLSLFLQKRLEKTTSIPENLSLGNNPPVDKMHELLESKKNAAYLQQISFAAHLKTLLSSQLPSTKEDFTRILLKAASDIKEKDKENPAIHISFKALLKEFELDLRLLNHNQTEALPGYSLNNVSIWHAAYILQEGKYFDLYSFEDTPFKFIDKDLDDEDFDYLCSLPLEIKEKFPFFTSKDHGKDFSTPLEKPLTFKFLHQRYLRYFAYLVSELKLNFTEEEINAIYKMYLDQKQTASSKN